MGFQEKIRRNIIWILQQLQFVENIVQNVRKKMIDFLKLKIDHPLLLTFFARPEALLLFLKQNVLVRLLSIFRHNNLPLIYHK